MESACHIIGLGEILWDVFPDGPRFGGAPANFAASTARLAPPEYQVHVVSSVGHDELGTQAIDRLREMSIDTSCVTRSQQPTGQVNVHLDDQGKASYEFAANTAWDNLTWTADFANLAAQAAATCFGTLAQRAEVSRHMIEKFIRATSPDSLRILDVNLRAPYFGKDVIFRSLELANVLKLNDEELAKLAAMNGFTGEPTELMRQLAEHYTLQAVALTRGSQGAILYRGQEFSEHPGSPAEVVDTVGAGDAFTAAFTLGLLADKDLDSINTHASQVAAHVCTQPGATPDFPERLRVVGR